MTIDVERLRSLEKQVADLQVLSAVHMAMIGAFVNTHPDRAKLSLAVMAVTEHLDAASNLTLAQKQIARTMLEGLGREPGPIREG